MKSQVAQLLITKIPLKLISLLLAYMMWHTFASHIERDKTCTVPLCFYGSESNLITQAPESVVITLRGLQKDLRALDTTSLAVHIDSDRLKNGPQEKTLQNADLFLPASVKLVHYTPNNIVITKQHA